MQVKFGLLFRFIKWHMQLWQGFMTKYQTDVAILGGGPSGLMLSRLLFLEGIRSVIIERQPMQHVLERIRAGVLEEGSVNLMQEAELGDRVLREGQRHSGFESPMGTMSSVSI